MNKIFGKKQWILPKMCNPPHRVTHWEKFDKIKNSIEKGWDNNGPMLYGYWLDDKIQLITGSHRWAAAFELGVLLPIYLLEYDYVKSIYGTNEWIYMIKNPPLINKFLYCNE